MHQARRLNSVRTATVICIGLLPSVSHAFVPPAALVTLPNNVVRQQQQQQQQEQRHTGKGQLCCSSTHKPSLKPSWKSPRRKESSTRSSSAQGSPTAVDVPGDGAAYSASATAEPPQGVPPMRSSSKYGKPTWKSTKTSNHVDSSSSSSSSSGSSNGGGESLASTSLPVLESFSDASPAENAPTTYSAGTTPLSEEPAQTVPPTGSSSVQQTQAATDNLPQPAAIPAASALPTSPTTLPFKSPPSRGKAVMEDVAVTLRRAKEALAPFRKKLQDNIAEGNVGDRGEEWAVAQAVILLCIALGSVPVVGGLVTLLAGPGLVVGGVAVGAAGVTGLGRSLSPWPAPVADNELKTDGIYGIMRHPTYSGLVMACLGFGVATDSPLRMLLAVLLAVVLDRKSEKEEGMLVGLHGEAYEEYSASVAKFVPGIY